MMTFCCRWRRAALAWGWLFAVASIARAVTYQPQAATPFRPVFRELATTTTASPDLVVNVAPLGPSVQFAEWRYGSPSSTRVAVLISARADDRMAFDLYVDRNRDRQLSPDELIPGDGDTRQFELATEWIDPSASRQVERHVQLQRTARGSVRVATIGYLEQSVALTDRDVSARRVDGDANGLWSDQADRLWLDLDGDGQWNAFREQFPMRPLWLDGQRRYTVFADALGDQLHFTENQAVGEVQLVMPNLSPGNTNAHVEVMFVGTDGSAFLISNLDHASLPGGDYAIRSLTISLPDPHDAQPHQFVFAAYGSHEGRRFHVDPAVPLTVDPVGRLKFVLEVRGSRAANGNGTLWIDPRLTTEDELLITSYWRGSLERASVASNEFARITVRAAGGVIDTTQSGFA